MNENEKQNALEADVNIKENLDYPLGNDQKRVALITGITGQVATFALF